MKTKLHYFITVVLLCFWGSTAFSQVTENVSFRSDGFYGQVTLTVKKSYYMEPYFNASPQKVVINSFENGKYDAILRAAGITFPYVLEKGAGFEFKAEAVIRKRDVLYGGFEFFESVPVSFSTSNTLGSGQVFPPFSEKAKKWLINGGNENSIVGKGLSGGEAAWGKYGEIDDIEVTRAYLDTKIKSVIAQHQSKEKDRASRFEALISEAKTIASGNNFIDARKRLAEAQKIMQGQEEKNTAREAEKFIDDKEQEKEKSEQKQKEEEDKKKAAAKRKIQSVSTSNKKDDDWWTGADKESTTTTISTAISNDDWWSGKDDRKTVSTHALDGGELVYGYFHSYFEDECTNRRIYVITNIFKYSSLLTSRMKAIGKFRELLETKYDYDVFGCSGYLQYNKPINTFKNNNKLTHEALIQSRHEDLSERREYVSNGSRYDLIVINDFHPYGN